MNDSFYALFYYGILIFGVVCGVLGSAIIILALKFVRANRMKYSVTGVMFLLGGAGIVFITLMTPSPAIVKNQINERLNLNALSLLTISVFEKGQKQAAVRINDQQNLAKWAAIVNTCQFYSPNHPRYEKIYHIVVELNNQKFLYELGLDSNHPDTADVTLLQADNFDAGYYNLGTYRCAGMFEFVTTLVSDI